MSQRMTLLILFAIGVWPLAAGAQQEPGAINLQRIQTEDLVLQVPATWVRPDDSNTLLTMVAPRTSLLDPFSENIRIKKYPLRGVADLDKIQTAQESGVEEEFSVTGSGVLCDGDPTTGEPRITWLAVAEKRPRPGEAKLTKTDYMMIHQGHLFVVHAMCETRILNESRQTFDEIARSIRFVQPSTFEPKAALIGGDIPYSLFIFVGIWVIFRLVNWKFKSPIVYRIGYALAAMFWLFVCVLNIVNPPPSIKPTGNAAFDSGVEVGIWLCWGVTVYALWHCSVRAIRGRRRMPIAVATDEESCPAPQSPEVERPG